MKEYNDKTYGDMFKEATSGFPAPPEEPESEGISLADMDGRTLRPTNKPVPRIHVVEKAGRVHTFQFVHLLSDSVFEATREGQKFIMEFAKPDGRAKITVWGRNLWKCYDYCHLHRWAYLKAAERDFAQGKEPIILAITIDEVKEA